MKWLIVSNLLSPRQARLLISATAVTPASLQEGMGSVASFGDLFAAVSGTVHTRTSAPSFLPPLPSHALKEPKLHFTNMLIIKIVLSYKEQAQ